VNFRLRLSRSVACAYRIFFLFAATKKFSPCNQPSFEVVAIPFLDLFMYLYSQYNIHAFSSPLWTPHADIEELGYNAHIAAEHSCRSESNFYDVSYALELMGSNIDQLLLFYKKSDEIPFPRGMTALFDYLCSQDSLYVDVFVCF
jgi:hypothetical protein